MKSCPRLRSLCLSSGEDRDTNKHRQHTGIRPTVGACPHCSELISQRELGAIWAAPSKFSTKRERWWERVRERKENKWLPGRGNCVKALKGNRWEMGMQGRARQLGRAEGRRPGFGEAGRWLHW